MRLNMIMLAVTSAYITVTGLALPALAQTMQPATVTMVRTGWNDDSFAVVTAEPILNPASCANPDGYISAKSFPGYETYYAAALAAITARRRVVVVVHNGECFNNRPKMIGINLTSDD